VPQSLKPSVPSTSPGRMALTNLSVGSELGKTQCRVGGGALLVRALMACLWAIVRLLLVRLAGMAGGRGEKRRALSMLSNSKLTH
jgi:hypothetical protein